MWLRIKEHLGSRFTEWVMALMLLAWGTLIATNPDLFSLTQFSGLAKWASYQVWATAAITIGIVRVTCLAINGAWSQSAHLRAFGSVCSMMVWVLIWLGYLSLPYIVPNLATIGGLAVLDFNAMLRAIDDAKAADAKRSKI